MHSATRKPGAVGDCIAASYDNEAPPAQTKISLFFPLNHQEAR